MGADRWPSPRLFITSILVGCGGSFHLGYQLTITNPSQDAFLAFVQDSFLNHFGTRLSRNTLEALWSVVIAILFIGGIFGSLTLRIVADRLGRKKGLMLGFFGIAFSSALSVFSSLLSSFELYTLSRFTIGWAITMSLGISGLYLAECSPKKCRGFVSMTTGLFVQVGLVVGSIVALPSIFGTVNLWWLIYLIEFSILAVVLALISFIHESPGYLLQHGYEEKAHRSILFFYGCNDYEADNHLHELKNNMRQNVKPLGMLEVLRHNDTRRPTIVGAMTAFAMTFSGVAVINAFAVEMLRNAGLSIYYASIANVGLSCLTLVGAAFSALIIDRFGRRPLLQITLTIIIVVNILVFVFMHLYSIYYYTWMSISLIVVVSIFMLAFAVGPGPLCYFITTELIAQHAKAGAQGWTSLIQMGCRSLILAIFLPLKNWIGAAYSYLLLFVLPMIFCLAFFYYFLPETKNRNLAEVEAEVQKLPHLPFGHRKTYQTNLKHSSSTLPQKDTF